MDFDVRTETIGWVKPVANAAIDGRGRDVVVVVAKISFSIGRDGRVRLAPVDVHRVPTFDPGGGVHRPSDLEADAKVGTDVGLVGTAHPPRGPEVRSWRAWLRVGTVAKAITVSGPRVYTAQWGKVVLSDPVPARAPVPLRWDHALGGRDPVSGEIDPVNPIGRGFASDPARLDGQLGPQLEPAPEGASDGGAALRASTPQHGAFAPIPAHWEPRRTQAGTHDGTWVQTRAPVRPLDFDPRHLSWSVPDLHAPRPLSSDAPVEVGGVVPEGIWRFSLPRYDVRFESVIDGEQRPHPGHLDTFLIDADARTVDVAWRTSILLPKKWERVERLLVTGLGDLGADVTGAPGPAPPARGAAA